MSMMNPEHLKPSSRMIYVKQDFMNEIQQKYQPAVLVNPHFINVKPHFNKRFLTNNTIHINPLFQQKGKRATAQEVAKISHIENNGSINFNLLPNQPNKRTIVKVVPKVQASPSTFNDNSTNINSKPLQLCDGANNLIVSTCTKLVRTPKKETTNNKRSSIHTKYKIIRTNVAESVQKTESNVKRLIYRKSCFKLDNRINQDVRKSKSPKKKVNYVRYNFKTNFDFNNSLIYKKRLSPVKRKSEHNRTKFKICKEKMLSISGQEYKLDSNHRTLTLMANPSRLKFKTRSVRVIEFKKKKVNVSSSSSFRLGSTKVQTKKLRKSNVPCPLYRKFGKCKGKDRGTCIRIHNPDQINLCPKFLQGACVSDKCLLSHKVSAEKMPTCKYYLNGLCSKDNCPYLHVKINSKADICKDFLEGFCKLAAECEKRHEYLCPDFEKNRKCMKQKCQYPHLNMVSSIIEPLRSKLRSRVEKPKIKQKNYEIANIEANAKSDDGVKESMKRYYDIALNSNDTVPDKIKLESDDMELSSSDNDDNLPSSKERKSIGELPSFIPFSID